MIPKKDDTEQRTLVAILLSLVVFWVWSAYFAPRPPPVEPDAVTEVAPPEAAPPVAEPSTPELVLPTDAVPERSVPVKTSTIEAELSSHGGVLRGISLPAQPGALHVEPLWTYVVNRVKGQNPGEWRPYGDAEGPEVLLSAEGSLLAAGAGALTEGDWTVEGEGPWVTTHVTPEGLVLTRTWRQTEDPTRMQVEIRYENRGSTSYVGELWVGTMERCEGEASRYANVKRPTAVVDGDLETLEDLSKAEEEPIVHKGPVSWFGVGDRYFLAAAIPQQDDWGTLTFALAKDGRAGAFLVNSTTLAPGASSALTMDVYLGGKDLSVLGALGHDMDKSVSLGMFGFFARILLYVLQMIFKVAGNWGVAIILLTVGVKSLFWPLTRKSFVSGRKMQALAPKLNEIRERYKDDQQAAGTAQMQLFQQEGVSPLSGCLPMVIQMPVWFALYSVLQYSTDIYHADFLYLRDLSSLDPYGVLPTLVGVLMIIQQQLTPASPGMDPMQQKMLKLMPLIFVGIMYAFPSGLALYIFINTLLSIAQMWMINRSIPVATPSPATT